jgi:signal transduction histidine kinase
MRSFHDLSIREKLIWMTVLSSGLALLLACAAFLAHERITFRSAMVQRLSILAEVLGYNATSAILFNDAESATSTLAALRANPHVRSAGVYDREGRLFASYRRAGEEATSRQPEPPAEPANAERYDEGRLFLQRQIASDGKPIGRIFLESDLGELNERVRRYAGIASLVFLASSLVALVTSSRLQGAISGPILHLAQVAKSVSAEKNYSVRAVSSSEDELGLLVRSFNEMLAQIQERDVALERARAELEQRVEERTRDLQQEIGERRQAEQALERQTEELARSNADLEQFAYVASHDLQEPLRMVGSYTQLLARRYQGKIDADADEFIHFAVDGVTRMQRLINDLLAYSRVGTHGNAFEPMDCEGILEKVLANLQTTIDGSAASVTHGALPTIVADASQMLQLFQNLIGNAIKFHSEGSPHVHVAAEPRGGDWLFSVSDNGIGIEPKYRDRIFVIFQRLHSRSEYPGTGIGLAICKKIVERHSGRIWVESEAGKGSTFHFTIPGREA